MPKPNLLTDKKENTTQNDLLPLQMFPSTQIAQYLQPISASNKNSWIRNRFVFHAVVGDATEKPIAARKITSTPVYNQLLTDGTETIDLSRRLSPHWQKLVVRTKRLLFKSFVAGALVYSTYRGNIWGDSEQTSRIWRSLVRTGDTPVDMFEVAYNSMVKTAFKEILCIPERVAFCTDFAVNYIDEWKND